MPSSFFQSCTGLNWEVAAYHQDRGLEVFFTAKSSLTWSKLVQVFIVSLPHRTTWAQQRSSWAWDELVCWNWLSPNKYWRNDYRLRLEMQACVKLRNAFGPVMSKVRMQFQAKRVICVDSVRMRVWARKRERERERGGENERDWVGERERVGGVRVTATVCIFKSPACLSCTGKAIF